MIIWIWKFFWNKGMLRKHNITITTHRMKQRWHTTYGCRSCILWTFHLRWYWRPLQDRTQTHYPLPTMFHRQQVWTSTQWYCSGVGARCVCSTESCEGSDKEWKMQQVCSYSTSTDHCLSSLNLQNSSLLSAAIRPLSQLTAYEKKPAHENTLH